MIVYLIKTSDRKDQTKMLVNIMQKTRFYEGQIVVYLMKKSGERERDGEDQNDCLLDEEDEKEMETARMFVYLMDKTREKEKTSIFVYLMKQTSETEKTKMFVYLMKKAK